MRRKLQIKKETLQKKNEQKSCTDISQENIQTAKKNFFNPI